MSNQDTVYYCEYCEDTHTFLKKGLKCSVCGRCYCQDSLNDAKQQGVTTCPYCQHVEVVKFTPLSINENGQPKDLVTFAPIKSPERPFPNYEKGSLFERIKRREADWYMKISDLDSPPLTWEARLKDLLSWFMSAVEVRVMILSYPLFLFSMYLIIFQKDMLANWGLTYIPFVLLGISMIAFVGGIIISSNQDWLLRRYAKDGMPCEFELVHPSGEYLGTQFNVILSVGLLAEDVLLDADKKFIPLVLKFKYHINYVVDGKEHHSNKMILLAEGTSSLDELIPIVHRYIELEGVVGKHKTVFHSILLVVDHIRDDLGVFLPTHTLQRMKIMDRRLREVRSATTDLSRKAVGPREPREWTKHHANREAAAKAAWRQRNHKYRMGKSKAKRRI